MGADVDHRLPHGCVHVLHVGKNPALSLDKVTYRENQTPRKTVWGVPHREAAPDRSSQVLEGVCCAQAAAHAGITVGRWRDKRRRATAGAQLAFHPKVRVNRGM